MNGSRRMLGLAGAYNALHKCMGACTACALNIDTYLTIRNTSTRRRTVTPRRRRRDNATDSHTMPLTTTRIPFFNLLGRQPSSRWRCTLCSNPIRPYRNFNLTNDTAKIHPPRSNTSTYRASVPVHFQSCSAFVRLSRRGLSPIVSTDRRVHQDFSS